MDQIAVGTVDLDDVVAGIDGTLRGFAPVLQVLLDVVDVHRAREAAAGVGREGAGGEALPRFEAVSSVVVAEFGAILQGTVRGRAAPAVAELHGGHGPEGANEVVDAGVILDVAVFVDTGAVVGLAAARFDGSLFAEDDARAAHGEAAEIHQLPFAGAAVVGDVLAHR